MSDSDRKREEGENDYKYTYSEVSNSKGEKRGNQVASSHVAKRLRVENQKCARNRKEWKKVELWGCGARRYNH